MNRVRGSTYWHTHTHTHLFLNRWLTVRTSIFYRNGTLMQLASAEQLIKSRIEENKRSRCLMVLQRWPADCSRARWLFTLFFEYPEFFLYTRAWVCSECTAHCKQGTDWKHCLCRGQYTTTACNHHHHPDDYSRVWQELFLTGKDERPRHRFCLLKHFPHWRWIKIIYWNVILYRNVLRQLVPCDANNILEP